MLLVEGKEKKKKPPRAHIVYSECSPSSLLHRHWIGIRDAIKAQVNSCHPGAVMIELWGF